MTIRQFAALCGCNPQTLRYYDREDLLKPVQVDPWSGYRYYTEEQALDYVTIRNLQSAGFSIGEIKELLAKDSSAVREAFDAKIAEQEQRLAEMKKIRESYRTEMTRIQEKITRVRDFMTHTMKQYDAMAEFGIDEAQYANLVDMTGASLDGAVEGAAGMPDVIPDIGPGTVPAGRKNSSFPNEPGFEAVYEKHNWRNAKEFTDDISVLEDGGEYKLQFLLSETKAAAAIPFMNTLLNLLLVRNPDKRITLDCDVARSADGANHFRLLRRVK